MAKKTRSVPAAPPHLLEATEVEAYVCDLCTTEVGAERVLVLADTGQIERHPDCHAFGRAVR